MTTVQSIFGLQAQQIMEVQYFDVKLLWDQTALWKTRTLEIINEYRSVRLKLKNSRFLVERRYLATELEAHAQALVTARTLYRQTLRQAIDLDRQYFDMIDKKSRRLFVDSVAV